MSRGNSVESGEPSQNQAEENHGWTRMDTDTEARTSQRWKFATPPNGDRQESARTGTAWSEHPCLFVSIRGSNESSGLSSGPPERSRRRILSTGSIRRLARLRLHARCREFVVTRARFRRATAGCPGGRWPRLRSSGSGRSERRSAPDRSSAYRPSWPGPPRGWHRRRCES